MTIAPSQKSCEYPIQYPYTCLPRLSMMDNYKHFTDYWLGCNCHEWRMQRQAEGPLVGWNSTLTYWSWVWEASSENLRIFLPGELHKGRVEDLQSPLAMSGEDAESDGEDFLLAAPGEQENVYAERCCAWAIIPERLSASGRCLTSRNVADG